MKKITATVLCLALAIALLAGCGSGTGKGKEDEVYTLSVTTHDAATSLGVQFMNDFFNQITEASGGRLQFTISSGGSLFGAADAVEAVRNGAADICWQSTSMNAGIFPLSEIINVPRNGLTCARMGSVVYNDILKEIPEVQEEMDDFYVLVAHASAAVPISTIGRKIEKPEDFKGLTIRTAGVVMAAYFTKLGAAPSSMPTSEVYEALSKKVIDGMGNDWHNIDCFKLYEVVDYCMDTCVNTSSDWLLMNKAKYESLPEDLQQLLDSFNDYGSAMAGYYWDSCQYFVADEMRENGVEVYTPTAEVDEFMNSEEMGKAMYDWYIDYLVSAGFEREYAESYWNQVQEIVARYADEYADPASEYFSWKDWDKDSYKDFQ